MTLSPKEQCLYHYRKFMSDYHLSFSEIERMPLDILLDMEVVDSKVEAAFEEKRNKGQKKNKRKRLLEDYI